MMRAFCLMLVRFCLAAWVGAALLFVATSVAEQISPQFDSATKNTLAVIRFPIYYLAGFATLGLALISSLLAGPLSRRRRWCLFTLTLLSLGIMLGDYFWVFQPLKQMMLTETVLRNAEFTRYHNLSKYLNMLDVLLVMLATLAAGWPIRSQNQRG